jgi:hypothetical protein
MDLLSRQRGTVMLVSLFALLAAVLTWLSSNSNQTSGSHGNALITPQDPSTLTLALIGAGTLGLYFAISRRARRRRAESLPAILLDDQPVAGAPTAKSEEKLPSRGAA